MGQAHAAGGAPVLDLAAAPGARPFIHQLLIRIAAAVRAQRATLSRLDGEWVVIEGSFDEAEEPASLGQRWAITSPAFRRMLATGEPTVATYDLASLPPEFAQQLAGVRHTVTVPLALEGEVFGTIAVSRRGDHPFQEVDLRTLRDLSGVAVLALRNATLLARAEIAADELRSSEERFRLLVEGVKDYAIFMLDETGQVTTWNQGAERIKGYRAQEIIGRSFAAFYPPEAVAAGRPAYGLSVAEREGRFEEEGWRMRKDGSRFWASVLITALRDEGGRLRGFAKVTRDITERKRMQDRTAILERMKSEFLNLASHELRTPVSLILGYLSLFEEGDLGELNAGGRRAVEVLRRQARELNALVEQMLEAARMQEGNLALHREEIDLRQAAIAAVDWIRGAAGPDHQLILLAPEQPLMVSADRRRLMTILHGLLDNAVKYSPQGGEVVCEVSSSGGRAQVRIRDHGLGMEPVQLDQLFRPFGRLVTEHTADIDGAGLGLYLARELARLHEGEIAVESNAGEGSAFTLSLPLVPQGAAVGADGAGQTG